MEACFSDHIQGHSHACNNGAGRPEFTRHGLGMIAMAVLPDLLKQ